VESDSDPNGNLPAVQNKNQAAPPRRLAVRAAILSMLSTAIGGYLGIYIAVYLYKPAGMMSQMEHITSETERVASLIDEYIEQHLNSSERIVNKLEDVMTMMRNVPAIPKELEIAIDLATLEAKIDEVEMRLVTFQGIVTDNPEKAMLLPVMRNDIEMVRREISRVDQLINSNADGMYNLLYFITGMNLTMLLAFAGLVGWTFIQGQRP
jgi:hypothetical protein